MNMKKNGTNRGIYVLKIFTLQNNSSNNCYTRSMIRREKTINSKVPIIGNNKTKNSTNIWCEFGV